MTQVRDWTYKPAMQTHCNGPEKVQRMKLPSSKTEQISQSGKSYPRRLEHTAKVHCLKHPKETGFLVNCGT